MQRFITLIIFILISFDSHAQNEHNKNFFSEINFGYSIGKFIGGSYWYEDTTNNTVSLHKSKTMIHNITLGYKQYIKYNKFSLGAILESKYLIFSNNSTTLPTSFGFNPEIDFRNNFKHTFLIGAGIHFGYSFTVNNIEILPSLQSSLYYTKYKKYDTNLSYQLVRSKNNFLSWNLISPAIYFKKGKNSIGIIYSNMNLVNSGKTYSIGINYNYQI